MAAAKNMIDLGWYMATPVAAGKASPGMCDLGLGKEKCTRENKLLLKEWAMGTTEAAK